MSGSSASDDLSALTNIQLANLAAAEQIRYRHHLPSNDRYALELYRRGIHQDQEAWQLFQEQVAEERVVSWLWQHPCYNRALERARTQENLVHLTFARFWQAVGPKKKNFSSQAKLFEFLKLCVNSVIIDELRKLTLGEIPPDLPAPAPDPLKDVAEEELWALLTHIITNPREQYLLRLILIEGYKPREVVRKSPEQFSTTQDVFRLWRNIIDRLRRDERIRRWFKKDTT
jgi:hypothetical protein